MIDSHCHLNLLDYGALKITPEALILDAKKNGVERILNVGVDLEHFKEVIQFAELDDMIDASFGLHPTETIPYEPTFEECVKYAEHKKVVAIGETGLDFYRDYDKAVQIARFEKLIAVGKKLSKPLIIHTRAARTETIDILKNNQAQGGVFHCFTEDWAMAKAGLDLGFFISFSGILTFKSAAELREVAIKTPLEQILVETDAPWLTPVPFRGKANRPHYVRHVIELLAVLKGQTFAEIEQATTKNYYRFIGQAPR